MPTLRWRSILAGALDLVGVPQVRTPNLGDGGTIFQDTRKPLVDWFRAMY